MTRYNASLASMDYFPPGDYYRADEADAELARLRSELEAANKRAEAAEARCKQAEKDRDTLLKRVGYNSEGYIGKHVVALECRNCGQQAQAPRSSFESGVYDVARKVLEATDASGSLERAGGA